MFLFSFNNSTCASPRDLTWLCVVIRIFTLHHAWYRIGGSYTNCGVIRESDGLCARCLGLPYCKKCKRHLNQSSFNGEQQHICQVHLQIVLFLHVAITCIFTYRYKSDYYLTYRYRYTFSRLCILTELRKTTYHTTHYTQ